MKVTREKFKQEKFTTSIMEVLSDELKSKIEQELIDKDKENRVKLLNQVLDKYMNKNTTENKNEIKNAVNFALDDIEKFINQGGNIDILKQSEKLLSEEEKAITNNIKKIRDIKKELLLLQKGQLSNKLLDEKENKNGNQEEI